MGDTRGFRLDVNNMMAEMLGAVDGITTNQIDAVTEKAHAAHREIHEKRARGELGFSTLPFQREEDIGLTIEAARNIGDRYENFVLLGIGGSALGPIAIQTALNPGTYNLVPKEKRGNRPRVFFVDNIDPESVEDLLELLGMELKETLFNVVTKSGGTAETLANFLIFRKAVCERLGREKASERFAVTTDPDSGLLRQIALEEGYKIFTIPKGVGGRFSVFTPVGLLPAAITGIDIRSMLAGARHMDTMCQSGDIWKNPAYLKGTLDFIAHVAMGRGIQVMMPYSDRLKDIADWYRQLWAESLGKRFSLTGEEVWAGTTPVKALGVIDQHSQLQLYLEGPKDKVITFLCSEEDARKTLIPPDFPEKEGIAYLGGHRLHELFEAERLATQYALLKAGRMTSTITLDRITPFTVGALLYFFEMETAFAGFLYNVNAFDQPGVEEGKRATYGMMGRPGYEGKKEEVMAMVAKRNPRYIIGE